jgi:hypothetical protein
MFRFTLRELVMATLIVAMSLGWYLNWAAMSRELTGCRKSNAHLRRVQEEAVLWARSAKEQMLRANFVSDQLHDRQKLKCQCPKCGTLVSFPPLGHRPWQPPPGSIWTRATLINP